MIVQNKTNKQGAGALANETENRRVSDKHCKVRILAQNK